MRVGSFTRKLPNIVCVNRIKSLCIHVIVHWQSAKVIARGKIKLTLSKAFSSVLWLKFFSIYIFLCNKT